MTPAMVGVAQLVEHLVVVQDAAGSSPVTHPSESCCSATAGRIPSKVATLAYELFDCSRVTTFAWVFQFKH